MSVHWSGKRQRKGADGLVDDRIGYEDDLKNREELRVLNRAGGFPFGMIVSRVF